MSREFIPYLADMPGIDWTRITGFQEQTIHEHCNYVTTIYLSGREPIVRAQSLDKITEELSFVIDLYNYANLPVTLIKENGVEEVITLNQYMRRSIISAPVLEQSGP